MPTALIRPALFAFLRELEANNERAWFEAHKDRYLAEVRDPLLGFIAAMGPQLAKISRAFVADPRPQGGSLFRIYRDTRFSKDKRPYKTNAGMQFRHRVGRDAHAPGFYLHLAPGEVFVAAGMWHPDARAAATIRSAIATKPAAWKRAVALSIEATGAELGGDELKRVPRDFAPDHACADDLRRKDFILALDLDEGRACAPGFIEDVAALFRGFAPFMRFLTRGAGLDW